MIVCSYMTAIYIREALPLFALIVIYFDDDATVPGKDLVGYRHRLSRAFSICILIRIPLDFKFLFLFFDG
jgi:hypothetical protein